MTERRILLVRHGRILAPPAAWMDAAAFERWREACDSAGLAPGESAPAALSEAAASACIVASDLPRARESAARLAPGRDVSEHASLREIPLAVPTWVPGRWPPAVWDAFVHLSWAARIVRGTDVSAEDGRRASECAAWLSALAQEKTCVITVTHGVFRRVLARALAALDWREEQSRRDWACWSVWEFRQDP